MLPTPFILPNCISNSHILSKIAQKAKYSKNMNFEQILLEKIQPPQEVAEISFL